MTGDRRPRSPISAQDRLWLKLDGPANPMLITAVLWTSTEVDPERLKRVVADRLIGRYPVFTRRPVLDGGTWFWEDDLEFSLDRHLTVSELPPPGTREVLQDLVAARRGRLLDPEHPLWTMELVRGYGAGSAVVLCSHHAMADGIRLVQVLFGLFDPVAGDAHPARIGGVGPRGVDFSRAPSRAAAKVVKALNGFGERLEGPVARVTLGWPLLGLSTVAGFTGAVAEAVTSALPSRPATAVRWLMGQGFTARNTVEGALGLLAPAASGALWSGEPGPEKTAAWGNAVPLDLLAAVGHATGTSVNDVCVALIMAAFERYAQETTSGSGEAEMNWLIPVSRSDFDDALPRDLGNDFALILAGFPLRKRNFRERLDDVHRRVSSIRESLEPALTFGVQWLAGRAPEIVSEPLTRFFAAKAVGVLTNVPGPRRPGELAGALVEGIVGWAPCSGKQAVTVCVFSYAGFVRFGFGTDRSLVPDPGLLVTALDDAVTDAVALTNR
ncbi:WS/DGAT domain-containing protein [Amycolatopsis sp. TNS106]|uniref:WS/DGAT domain-containing protein n=1 Tax=Amycolatopsis sp. TNS106 TaxID=2861750 RepID=UPI001C598DF1|nr:WS/DGAT domain-containing protein [Amycolatopsis sp. TNS106]